MPGSCSRRQSSRPIVGFAGVALFVLAVATGAARVGVMVPAHGGAVVFASDFGIEVANMDGTGLAQLSSSNNLYEGEPVWSPNGRQIAFDRTLANGDALVMVMNANGSGVRRLAYGRDPAWSPDGAKIALHDGALEIVDLRGRVLRRLAGGQYGNYSWSPDGKKLAYMGGDRPSWVRVAAIPTGSTKTLATLPYPSSTGLAWSPDGSEIAFTSRTLELVDLSGRVRSLTKIGWNPVWSPDGSRLAFLRGRDHGPYVIDLFTIGRTGRGKRRVASLGFGDSSGCGVETQTVSWSRDSHNLVYERCRFAGSEATDIWRVRSDGSAARPITNGFPTGASFWEPRWAATEVPSRPVKHVSMVSLKPSNSVRVPTAVLGLAADGNRAVIQARDDLGAVGAWDIKAGLSWIADSSCDLGYPDLAMAGARAGWTCIDGETQPIINFDTGTAGAGTTSVASANGDDEQLGNLAGDEFLLVFNTWNVDAAGGVSNPQLWQITDAQPAAAQLLASGADAFRVLAVDAGRVAVLRPDGTLVILNEQGERVSAFNLGSQKITAARLTKSALVALRGGSIEVRDATTGTLAHRWRTAESDAPVTLEDAEGNFAVYTAGIAIHLLRLSDGRDRTLKIPNEAQPAHAQLEAEGLYYSYNETGSTKPGRVAFVPASELTSR